MSTVQPESDREPDRCPSCGAARPANAPRGLCPRCRLRQGLEGSGVDGTGPPSESAAGTSARERGDSRFAVRFAEFHPSK